MNRAYFYLTATLQGKGLTSQGNRSTIYKTIERVVCLAAKNITFRLDETLKKQAEIIYESMGLNMSSALQLFVVQTVARGSIPFIIEADDNAKYRAYVLRELAESKMEAMDPAMFPEDHDEFLSKWDAKRKARQNGVQHQETQVIR